MSDVRCVMYGLWRLAVVVLLQNSCFYVDGGTQMHRWSAHAWQHAGMTTANGNGEPEPLPISLIWDVGTLGCWDLGRWDLELCAWNTKYEHVHVHVREHVHVHVQCNGHQAAGVCGQTYRRGRTDYSLQTTDVQTLRGMNQDS